jgi:hypothetical protein
MVAPGAYGVKIGDEFRRELGGEGFAVQFLREAGGEVLEENDANGNCVAGRPGSWLVAENTELDGEVRALGFDGGVDAAGVELEPAHLFGWKYGKGPVGGCTDLEGTLEAIVGEHTGTNDLGEVAGDVAAKGVHLPEAVLSSDVALSDDEIVERGGADVGYAMGIPLDGDWGRETSNREGTVELGQGVAHCLAGPVAGGEEDDDGKDEEKRNEDRDCPNEQGCGGELGRAEEVFATGSVEEWVRFSGFGLVVAHALTQG